LRRWTKRNKYGSIPTKVGYELLDSKREAGDYVKLQILAKAGKIAELKRQARVPLIVSGSKVADYICDFTYFEPGRMELGAYEPQVRWLVRRIYDAEFDSEKWRFVLHDSKGWRTQVYSLKAKLVKALYGITIRET